MSTINKIQDEVIEEFDLFDDWMDKYEYLIELGKQLDPLDAQYKTEDNLVKGCQSRVWLHPERKGDKMMYYADSDALISKGLIGLLLKVYSGQNTEEILQSEPYFIKKIGLDQHLSPNRANGLASMIKKIKTYALAYAQ